MLAEKSSFMVRGDDGEEYGPVDLDELREWVRENRAGLGTEVRRDEPGATWNTWQAYPELVVLLAEAQSGASPLLLANGLVLSSVWQRLAAFLIDLMLLVLLLGPLHLLLDHLNPLHKLLYSINLAALQSLSTQELTQVMALALIENTFVVLYFTICHAGWGQTPAQAMFRMRVINAEGERPSVTRALMRSLALVFSLTFYVPLVYVFMNPRRRSFHDVVADTCVVNT